MKPAFRGRMLISQQPRNKELHELPPCSLKSENFCLSLSFSYAVTILNLKGILFMSCITIVFSSKRQWTH